MVDNRTEILNALVTALTPVGLDIYSFVPNDMTKPYIYIGDLFFEELQNKDAARLRGIVTIELVTGTNAWIGSFIKPLEWYNSIKYYIKPFKTATLLDNMVYLRLSSDTGLEQINEKERVFVGTLQYEFEIQQEPSIIEAYYNRVTADGGIIESLNCLINIY